MALHALFTSFVPSSISHNQPSPSFVRHPCCSSSAGAKSATCALTIENQEIVRRSANWKPNVWDYGFLQSLTVDYTVMIVFSFSTIPSLARFYGKRFTFGPEFVFLFQFCPWTSGNFPSNFMVYGSGKLKLMRVPMLAESMMWKTRYKFQVQGPCWEQKQHKLGIVDRVHNTQKEIETKKNCILN